MDTRKNVRKNVRSLTSEEKKKLVDALLLLKKEGKYDGYVHWHHEVMKPTVWPYEPKDAIYRNGAHRGPAFLPWHREFLMQVENDLQEIDSSITIPYWDWTEDAAMEHPESSPIWKEDLMGGNGVEEEGWRVGTGPFAFEKGNWPIPMGHDGPALTRRLGSFPQIATLPTTEDLNLAMSENLYDTPPYSFSPFIIGFRNRIEGWVTQRGDSRVKTSGSQLHNRVHLWVGGTWKQDGEDKVGSMVLMTSPNDPVFFLHHCFIDKVWADWQERQQRTNLEGYPHYAPEEEGPPGHNLNDQLHPWERRILQVLDISKLGYEYEQTPSLSRMLERAVAAAPTFPFDVGRTPFEAE